MQILNRQLFILNIIVLTFALLVFTIVSVEGRLCKTHQDCLGDFIQCCSGYCRQSCNLSCSRNDQCGSPPNLEEYCCKGTCISTSLTCEKPAPEKENVLSPPLIAVVAIFGVLLVITLCCVFWAQLCKMRALCFAGNRGSRREANAGVKISVGAGFMELGRVGTDESLNVTERFTLRAGSNSWVGQDFRVVPPKSLSKRNNHD